MTNSPPQILLVEDNPVFLKLMNDLLVEVEGHNVLVARDGLEALELLGNFMPDVIFVDWIMAKISGEQLCKIIRSKPQFQDCYLVILSGMAAEVDADLFAAGADAYIAKENFKSTAEHIKLVLREAACGSGRDFSKTILGLDQVHKRRASLELLKRNKHYGLVLQNIFDGVIVLSVGTRDGEMKQSPAIIWVNQAACKILDECEEDVLASSLSAYFGGPDRNRLEVVLAAIEDQPILINEDQPLRVKDRYVTLACIPFVDSGEMYVTCVMRDLTNQINAERALHKSEQQLQLALEAANVGMWDWDIQNDNVYFSPRYAAMLGYGPGELISSLTTWEELLHPEDLQSAKQQLQACLAQEPSEWNMEFRLRTKEGGYRWILGQGQVVEYSADGVPIRAAGTHVDITERKQTEFALQKAAMEWSTAMDASDDAVYLLDMDRRILRANRVFCLMAGVDEEEIIGRHITEVVHPQGEEIPCQVCRAQEKKKNAEVIMEADHPDNHAGRPVKVTVKIVQDDQGQPISILMNIHDLTRQRGVEDALLRSANEWEKTFDSMSDIVTIQDREMRIVRANRAAHDMLELDPADVKGRFCYQLFSGGSEPCPGCPEISTLKNIEAHSAIIHHARLNKVFLVSSSPILDDNNQVQYLIHVAKDITEQKRLEEQQVMFSSLLQQSNDAIYVVDPSTTNIIFANRQGAENLGCSQEELASSTIYDLCHQVKEDADWQHCLAEVNRCGSYLFETTQKRKDGSLLAVEVNSRLVSYEDSSYVVAVMRDISERKLAEAKAFQEHEKLQAVVDALGVGLTFNALDFKILYQNKVHRQQWGDVVGEFCYKATQGRDAVCPNCQLTRCFEDGQIHQSEYAQQTDSGTVYLEVLASPFRDVEGEIVGGVETVRDITDRKLLEVQVQQAQKMEAIGTLAGGIAHDFNNILAAIMGYNEMALQDIPVDNPVHGMLEHVGKGAERARDLVQQILTFSRRAGQQMAPMLLQPVIKEALKLLRASIPTTIAVQSSIAVECGFVKADPTMVHQLVMNLCTNSYHAMRETGGQLSISLRPITVDRVLAEATVGLQEGPYLQLTVSDTGHGMDASTVKRIFDPYFTTKDKGEGTGLGLAVVHGIVTKLHGAITVTSELGAGTTIRVFLPLDGVAQPAGETLAVTAPQGQGHILLVDDEEVLTDMASLMLSRLGYQVTSFNNSSQAFEAFTKNPGGFDLIITDQTMPGLTGVDLAQQVLEIRSNMAILLMSGYSEQVDPALCRRMGISGYLPKPFTDYELGEATKMILDKV